jgi:YdjC-like protein
MVRRLLCCPGTQSILLANDSMNYRGGRTTSVTSSASPSLGPGTISTTKMFGHPGIGCQSSVAPQSGRLILNADDWGRDCENTDRILHCAKRGTISSASAMVFMEDSERAAALARESEIDAGLHLNLTMPFSASRGSASLLEHQRAVSAYLLRHRLAQIFFHPGLIRSFDYVVKAQLDEFSRIYGAPPSRIDGHHHMHLCANVQLAGLLPAGTVVRRNFSFQRGEKGLMNRLYRQAVDRRLARRHPMVDFLFSLPPLESQQRLERIRFLARDFVVEVETHPINADEYRFLTGNGVARWTGDVPIAPRFSFPQRRSATPKGEWA